MRIPIIAGNWKMNSTVSEAVKLVNEILPEMDKIEGIEKVVCPPFVSLVPVKEIIKGSSVKLGAQNLYFEEKGPFTGEISALMLVNLCEYVIIGHSERRQYFQESGEMISKKVLTALKNGLKPILCVGERLEEYNTGKTEEVVVGQVKSSLSGVSSLDGLSIAYEPVWAIGTGKAATGLQANDTINLIRRTIKDLYNEKTSQDIRILYGGSVTGSNITEFVQQPDIDGGLVGGASLKAKEFTEIVRQTAKIKASLQL